MEDNKCAKELLQAMKSQKKDEEVVDCSDDGDIEIVVVDSRPSPLSKVKTDAMDFWLSRGRHKAKQNCINLDTRTPPAFTTSALLAPRINPAPAKVVIPIMAHERERSRQVINVQQASAKINAEKYRNKLFKIQERKPAQKVNNQQLARVRMERQERELADGDKPRWKQEKEKREEINRCKYPITSISTYGYDHHPATRGLDTFNEATWQQFLRKQEISKQKNRQKREQERRRERQRQKQLKKQKIMDETALFQQFAHGMFGSKKQKNEVSDAALMDNQPGMEASRVRDTIEEESVVSAEEGEAVEPRLPRYGLKDIVMLNQSPYSSEIIRAVLAHDFSTNIATGQAKKIPDVFEDCSSYKRVFHFLIANEGIADVQQRMQEIEKEDSSVEPIKVSICNVKSNTEGQTEIYMKEVQPKTEKGFLRGFSLSRLRIGLLTNQKAYKRQAYGWTQNYERFAILVVLVTPETKEEMEYVKALAKFKAHDIEMLLRKNKREAYFYDLDKLTTNYREYQAVTHMPHSDLAPVLLDPRLMEREMGKYISRKEVLNDILKGLQDIFNQTQCESIREMVLREKGIVMLQGPPGTGKTSTLMGLLAAQFEYLKRTADNRKIMICAPSNAAVDHIVKRLLTEGIFNGEGEIVYPNALRVGIVDTHDETVRSVSLDNLCEKKMIEEQKRASESGRLSTIEIKDRIVALQTKKRQLNKPGNEKEYNEAKMEELRYQQMLFNFKAEKVVISRKQYRYFQSQYLTAADIILTTLSSSGNQKLEQLRGEIACLIIDEAAQATEPNLLIALQTGVQKVLLIGDPYQLPATCMSTDCNVTLFNRSLFQRFLDAGNKPYFLNIQYRMAPMIRTFPSRRFYQNRLIDAASVAERATPPFLECFNGRSVAFVDIRYSREEARSNSFFNQGEAKAVGMLVRCLSAPDVSMGIITPYQAQRSVILREAKNELMKWPQEVPHFEKNVMINTVDSFQGQQKDIIIVSTVRANAKEVLGFLTDQRRINVTLTRSKYLMIVVGNGDTLGSNQVWNDFLEWAQREKVYFEVPTASELQDTLRNMFTFPNSKPINRKRHARLSKDIRRQQREHLDSCDIKSKKAQDKLAGKKEKNGTGMSPVISSNALQQTLPNKYALDIKQSQKIRDQKRQKEIEAEQFQEMQSRLREFEQQMRNDKDYADLFK